MQEFPSAGTVSYCQQGNALIEPQYGDFSAFRVGWSATQEGMADRIGSLKSDEVNLLTTF
jgi:hypothetical protein